MAAKAIFLLFAQALLIQSALSQNCGRANFAPAAYSLSTPTIGYDRFSTGWAGCAPPGTRLAGNSLAFNGLSSAPLVEVTSTSGGGLPVTSASPISPNTIVVESENVYEGTLAVAGDLPFVGTVGLEGDLPTVGSGAVNHACGNGATRMISQDGAAIVNNIGTGYASSAFGSGNMYGSIGGLPNPALASPYGFNAGLGGFAYPPTGSESYTPGLSPYGVMGSSYGSAPFGAAVGYGSGIPAYGGAGEGNVAVAGELPVAGNTAVAGQVPIMGAVSFGGAVPAAGAVSITGNCACGCGYQYFI